MNKFILLSILTCLLSFQSKSQFFSIPKWDYYWDLKAHEKGQVHFSYGYGQPRLDKKLFDYQRDSTEFRVIGIGPFFLKTELGLSRKLSVLLSATYIKYRSEWTRQRYDAYKDTLIAFDYGTVAQDISVNLRLNYHLFVNRQWDIYIGGGAGYNSFKNTDFTTYAPEDSTFKSQFKIPYPVSFEMSFGIRYFFLTRTAIYVEAGYGKALAQAGFVFKFRHRKRI